jgi:hypothetical protein
VVAAMNDALEMAQTEFISFAAADDIVLPGLYEQSVRLLQAHPDAAFCSSVTRVSLTSGEAQTPLPSGYPRATPGFVSPAEARELLLRGDSWVVGTTVVHRRRCLLEAGGFRPALQSYCDGFLYQAMALKHGACFIPTPFAVWKLDDRGYSRATSRDSPAMRAIVQAADQLMRGEFSEVFPPRLRGRINRRLRFRALSQKVRRFEADTGLRGIAKALQLFIFCALLPHDVPREVLSRLGKGRIGSAP